MKTRSLVVIVAALSLASSLPNSATTTAMAVQIPILNATATQFSGQFPPASAHDGLTNESVPGPGPHTDTYWLSENGLLSDTITFDLDTTLAPSGWSITQVDIVNTSNSGWNDRETDEFGLEVFNSSVGEWIEVVPDATPIDVYWPDTKTVAVSGFSNITRLRLNVTNDPAIGPGPPAGVGGNADAGTGLNEVTIFGEPPGFIPFDFDGNGVVNEADYAILAANLGAHFARDVFFEDGDSNFDRKVDLVDFGDFKANFSGVFAAATGVPEPATLGLAGLFLTGVLVTGRCRRTKRSC